MIGEVFSQDLPKVLLSGAVGRTVIVCQVEVRDATIEGTPDDGAAGLKGIHAAEVLPESKRDRWKDDPRTTTFSKQCIVVSLRIGMYVIALLQARIVGSPLPGQVFHMLRIREQGLGEVASTLNSVGLRSHEKRGARRAQVHSTPLRSARDDNLGKYCRFRITQCCR